MRHNSYHMIEQTDSYLHQFSLKWVDLFVKHIKTVFPTRERLLPQEVKAAYKLTWIRITSDKIHNQVVEVNKDKHNMPLYFNHKTAKAGSNKSWTPSSPYQDKSQEDTKVP